MAQNTESILNESHTSHFTKTSDEKEYTEITTLINNIPFDDKTNNSVLSISKIEKSNSLLSNQDLWNNNNNKDDSKVFYQKYEEFQKGNYPRKRIITYVEDDYDDEDLDERIEVMKTDQIQQMLNKECKQNNLNDINNISNNGLVSPSETSTSSISETAVNALLHSIEKAKYFTPKGMKINNDVMNLTSVKKELNFTAIKENNNNNVPITLNGTTINTNTGICGINRNVSPSSQWQNSKKTFVVPSSKFDLPFPNNQGYSGYNNGKSFSFVGKSKNNIPGVMPFPTVGTKDSNHSLPSQQSTSINTLIMSENNTKKIDIDNIIIGNDKRTTLMLRNIPNKYTLNNIIDEISPNFWGKYDYINLPIDYERKLNLGYAFINFIDPLHIILFYETYHFKKWSRYKSDKKMDMTYADKQGKKDVSCKDTQSYFIEEDKRFNYLTIQPKIEITINHLDFFKKIYPNAVCPLEDKSGLYNDRCFVVKSLGKK